MTLTLLIDLDDTLLLKSTSDVFPAYLKALSNHLKPLDKSETVFKEIFSATDLMGKNTDPQKTLKHIFDGYLQPKYADEWETIEAELNKYYRSKYHAVSPLSAPNPDAADFMRKNFESGYTVAIATNPYFPIEAIEQRLDWAGLSPEKFPYAAITSYETFHFTKPHLAYYAEVLARLGWPEMPAVMIGNDIEMDIHPTQAFGLASYHLTDAPFKVTGKRSASGPLSEFHQWIETLPEETLTPNFKKIPANLAIMTATPAAVSHFAAQVPVEDWAKRPLPEEWSLTEIFCHLRDVDREVHIPRFEMVQNQANPHIQAVDADKWADERQYIQQDGQQALAEFLASRQTLLGLIQTAAETAAEKPIQHTIFGPTTLEELVRIAARHDRLHIQQIYAQLNGKIR